MLKFENNAKIETAEKKKKKEDTIIRLCNPVTVQPGKQGPFKQNCHYLEEKYYTARRKQWQPDIHMRIPKADVSDTRNVPEERTDNSVGLVL